ncbi:hypothetical protein BD311DRAFT_740784 [Dichomitus squalens]|uniref:Uncharacterized protein n=1 Tax=Dichomitus squalens TaxID=114155 RepID=A0A4Q9MFT4_9APHY|nr:hypothetical protein BD311DRAFT_740784 [Dichomitus squalens]
MAHSSPTGRHSTLTGLFAQTGLQTHRPWRICDIEVTVEGVLLELVLLSVQVILLVRASVGAMAFSMNMASGRFEYDGHCLVTASPKVMLVVWYGNKLSPTVFEAVLFAMTIAKFKQSRGEGLGRRPILDTIVRDGTWAFLVGIAVMVLNTLVYTSAARNALSGAAYLIDDKLDIVGSVIRVITARVPTYCST